MEHKTRLGGDSGAALVEAAFVLPVLFAVLLAVFTGGMAFNASISMHNASREGARYGATLPVSSDMAGWLGSVADVTISAATDDLAFDAPGQYVCVAYVHPNGAVAADRTTRLTEIAGVRTVTPGATCTSDILGPDERRVQVVVERDATLEVIFFTRTLRLRGSSVSRFERSD